MVEEKSQKTDARQPTESKPATAVTEQETAVSWDKGAAQTSPSASSKVGPQQLLILLVLSLMLAIIVIDSTIVNIALPSIQKEFFISVKDLTWIVSLYALVFGSFLLTWGKFGDEFGRKKIFIAGVLLFIVGSTVDGVSLNLSQMLVGRVLQGFGAAMASPSTLSILTTTFTGKARGLAFGIWGAVAGAAAVLGPLLGGFFTTYYTWRWAFLVNVPIGIAALIGAIVVIKESRFRDPNYSTDYLGVTLITASLSSLLFGFIEGQTYGWLTPNETFTVGSFTWPLTSISLPAVTLIAGTILLATFVYAEKRRQRAGKVPLFDLSLFQYKGFRFGIFTVTIVAMGEFGVIFFLSIYFQIVRGLSAIDTGITFLPMAIALFVSAPLAGMLSSRIGPKWIITAGMALEAIALFSLSQVVTVTNPIEYFYPVLVVYGAGVGLAIGQLTNTVLMSVPWQKAGVGSGANGTVRQVGSAFGVAVIGAVLAAQISTIGQADLATSTIIPAALKTSLAAVFNAGLVGGAAPSLPPGVAGTPLAATITSIFNDAITQGTRWAAITAGIFVSLGALSSLLIPNARTKPDAEATLVTVRQRRPIGVQNIVILTEFITIIGLLAAISSEYISNPYMQQWFGQNAWPIGYLLSNYLGSLLITVIGIVLIIWKMVPRQTEPPKPEANR